MIAEQDQSLATTSYYARIIKDGTDPMCKICNRNEETIDHIVSNCPELAKTELSIFKGTTRQLHI